MSFERKTNYIRKKFAFTLAEVLITLGIIGIVAALTIPILMNSYQENANRNKLKNAYAIISEATKQMQNDNGNTLWPFSGVYADSVTMKNMYKQYLVNVQDTGTAITMGNYKMYKGGNQLGFTFPFLTLPDGTILAFFSYPMSLGSINGLSPNALIYVDVQGGKGPKMFGVDTFVFELQKDKGDKLFVYPIGTLGDGASCQVNMPCTGYGDCQKAYGCTAPFLNGETLP